MLMGFLLTSFGIRTYTTETLLVLEDTNAALASSLQRNETQYLDPTEAVAVFGSRRVFERAVDELDLTNDAEFNPYLAEENANPGLISRLFSGGGERTDSSGSEGSESLDDGSSEEMEALERQATVDVLQGKVYLEADGRTTLISVVATTESPERSAQLSNAVAEAFLNELLETRLDALDRVAEQLSLRVASLRQDVQESEAALQDFLNASERLSAEDLTVIGDEAQRLRARLVKLQSESAADAALMTEANALAGLADEEVRTAIQANVQLAELFASLDLTPDVSVVDALKDKIANRSDHRASLIDGLNASLTDLDAQLAESSEQKVRLQQLQREADAASEIYDFSVRRLNELLVQSGVESGGGRIVLRAAIPQEPDGRGRPRTMVILGILGLVTSIGWTLLREATDQTLRTRADVQRLVPGVRCVAVPRAVNNRQSGQNVRAEQLFISDDVTEYSEAIRRLRGDVSSVGRDGGAICLQATSDFVSAGKSLVLLSLARSFALLGKKVLVIGADMRDMSLGKQLDLLDPALSLQQVLNSEIRAEDAIITHQDLGIDLILPARQQGNPVDVLEGPAIGELLQSAQSQYDVVLIDTPPLLDAAEAQVVSKLVDSVLLVAGVGASTSESLVAALDQLPLPLDGSDVVALYAAKPEKENWGRVNRRKFARL